MFSPARGEKSWLCGGGDDRGVWKGFCARGLKSEISPYLIEKERRAVWKLNENFHIDSARMWSWRYEKPTPRGVIVWYLRLISKNKSLLQFHLQTPNFVYETSRRPIPAPISRIVFLTHRLFYHREVSKNAFFLVETKGFFQIVKRGQKWQTQAFKPPMANAARVEWMLVRWSRGDVACNAVWLLVHSIVGSVQKKRYIAQRWTNLPLVWDNPNYFFEERPRMGELPKFESSSKAFFVTTVFFWGQSHNPFFTPW